MTKLPFFRTSTHPSGPGVVKGMSLDRSNVTESGRLGWHCHGCWRLRTTAESSLLAVPRGEIWILENIVALLETWGWHGVTSSLQ